MNMALPVDSDAQKSNDSFFFVPVNPETAGEKAPTRNSGSRAHVMRFVRRRDQSDEKWRKKGLRLDFATDPKKEPGTSNVRPWRWRQVDYSKDEQSSQAISVSKTLSQIPGVPSGPSSGATGKCSSEEHLIPKPSAQEEDVPHEELPPINQEKSWSDTKGKSKETEETASGTISYNNMMGFPFIAGTSGAFNLLNFIGISQHDVRWQKVLYSCKSRHAEALDRT